MWKSALAPYHFCFFYPTPPVENHGPFQQLLSVSAFSTYFPRGIHRKPWKAVYCLLLMLVVISFTFSAKAGSVRICCSTFFSECRMVE